MIDFPLHSLGWKAFQDLGASVLSEVLGQSYQTFLGSHDAGRDGAFTGVWHPAGDQGMTGTFTTQCKFSARPGANLTPSDLQDELAKARRLVARGLADNYLLLTNSGISGATEERLRADFCAVGVKQFRAYGYDWLNRQLNERPRLRRLVPRVYGLGDLSEILDDRVLAQTQEILEALGSDLSRFVCTDAYRKSELALRDHRFVLLLGEPSAGKSTIAAALAIGAADDWDCLAIKLNNAADFRTHWNPNDPRRLFWIDDAFGATQLDADAARAWNATMPHLVAAMRQGVRVIMTSRDYVYKAARPFLQIASFPILNEHQVVVRVQELTRTEREQILYNHLRMGSQPSALRRRLKPFLPEVASNPHFMPEIAKRLGDPVFTAQLSLHPEGVRRFVEEPVDFLVETIRGLDAGAFSALAAIFLRGGSLASPMEFSRGETNALARLNGTVATVTQGLAHLDESLVRRVNRTGSMFWIFRHPTVRDAMATLVAENVELTEIYLLGVTTGRLMREVTCGAVEIEGAKVRVAPAQNHVVIGRLQKFAAEKGREGENRLHSFLTYRCDRNFLADYIKAIPDFVKKLRVGSYLTVVSDVAVLARLNEFGLLTEVERAETVAAVRDTVVTMTDAGFLHGQLEHLLTEKERSDLLQEVEAKVIPRLEQIVDNERSNWTSSNDPEEDFSGLKGELETFREAFADKPAVAQALKAALEQIEDHISDLKTQANHWDPDDGDRRPSGGAAAESSDRSIFDDVDT